MLMGKQFNDIKKLQEICENEGGFHLKLNEDLLKNRNPDLKDDFLYYQDEKLIGFLGMYGFGSSVEICGMVHPYFRRQHIFTELFKEMLAEAKKRQFKKIILNSPSKSLEGQLFLAQYACTYSFSEYQMQWQEKVLNRETAVQLKPSQTLDDREIEIQLDFACFGIPEAEGRRFYQERKSNPYEQMFIIETEGEKVGKIRYSILNGEFWIYGFAVFPKFQGRGIGRKALSLIVMIGKEKGLPVFLEVEAKNKQALNLYESCGFVAYHSQDYYLWTDTKKEEDDDIIQV